MAPRGGARPGAGRKPGQVSQAKRDIAEMAKGHAAKALEVLIGIASNSKAPSAARVSAASAILDRGYGKPRQAVDMDGAFAGSLTVTYVTGPTGPAPILSDEDYETDE